MRKQSIPATLSDAELLDRLRATPADDAMAELYRRHVDHALRIARAVSTIERADALVAESFSRMWEAVSNGSGPTNDVRPYLGTVIRNLNSELAQATIKEHPASDKEWLLDTTVHHESDQLDDPDADATLVIRALQSLPQKWQCLLIELDVNGRKAGEVATEMSMSAAAVSSAAYRAREGLTLAYLDQHIPPSVHRSCRWTRDRLSKFVREQLSTTASAKVDKHLDRCTDCAAIYADLRQMNRNMRALAGPLGLAVAAGGALTSFTLTSTPKPQRSSGSAMALAVGAVGVIAIATAATILAMTRSGAPAPSTNSGNQPAAAAPARPEVPGPNEASPDQADLDQANSENGGPTSGSTTPSPKYSGSPQDLPTKIQLGEPQILATGQPVEWLLTVPVTAAGGTASDKHEVYLDLAMSDITGFIARISPGWDCGPIQDGDPNGNPYFFITVTCHFAYQPGHAITPLELIVETFEPSGTVTARNAEASSAQTRAFTAQ